MPDVTPPVVTTPENAPPGTGAVVDQSREPIAPERTPEVSKELPAEKTFTQAELDQIVTARLERERKSAAEKVEKTVEDQVKEIKEQLATVEETAVRQILARATTNAHNPQVAAQLIKSQLGDLTSKDEAAILQKAQEFLTANPYLVKTETGTPAPNLTPAPGVTVAPSESTYLTREQMDAIDVNELAKDEALMAKYLASVDHYAGK